jgi:hypothetical protein
MSSPFTSEYFVMESFDFPKPCWARNPHDVFPLFISFQDLFRNFRKSLRQSSVFVDFPHSEIVLYLIWYVKYGGVHSMVLILQTRDISTAQG